MEKFNKKINEVNEDPEFQSFMTAEEDYQMCLNTDMKIAREEGHTEGLAEGKNQVIKNILASGFSIEEVSKMTKMPIEEIEKINKE